MPPTCYGRAPRGERLLVRVEEGDVHDAPAEGHNPFGQLARAVAIEREQVEDRGVRVGGRGNPTSTDEERHDGHEAIFTADGEDDGPATAEGVDPRGDPARTREGRRFRRIGQRLPLGHDVPERVVSLDHRPCEVRSCGREARPSFRPRRLRFLRSGREDSVMTVATSAGAATLPCVILAESSPFRGTGRAGEPIWWGESSEACLRRSASSFVREPVS